jgi:hypothetical protein
MLKVLLFPAFAVLACLMGLLGWALVELVVEMFRHRDYRGIQFYDGGMKYDMASWFEPLPGDRFYGYK